MSRLGIPFEEIIKLVDETIGEVVPFHREHYILAAKLWKSTKEYGLSLGDRACIALAQHMELPVYTADRIWTKLNIKDLQVNLIR